MEGRNKNSSSCLEKVQFSQCDVIRHGSSKGMLKDKPVATRQLLLASCDKVAVFQNEEHWKHLINLRDDNLVKYHQCSIKGEARHLVMDLCEGSMLDYCRKKLDDNVALFVKGIDIIWQITCGMDYLNRHKIHHGNLMLENVLFWKRNSSSKRIVVKLAGYGYKLFQNQNNIKDDRYYQLGCLYYSAATKDEAEPNDFISLESLTEIEISHRSLALDLIYLLIKGEDRFKFEMATLLRHPLFIRSSEDGKARLIKELTDGELCHDWNSKEKLQKWRTSTIKGTKLQRGDFDDLADILLSETKDISQLVAEALRTTPQLFAEYIWYVSFTDFAVPKETNQIPSIEIHDLLGKGNYGKVFKCNYTDRAGKQYPAACKRCNTKRERSDMFNREIQTISQLNHLFVIKYLDVVENSSKKYIVMELCDGSLKDYVEGMLEGIPKDSLDDKILVSQITLGVAYIHHKGIIHKDLKLENILLKRQSPRLVLAKIADFGFAKELKPGKAEFSDTSHPGTENYMAPELLTATKGSYPASFASDVYALGITIARIVKKGDHPFSLDKLWRTASMVKGLVPPNLQDFSWDLIDLILKLTDKDPGKRPEMSLVLCHPYFVLTNDRTKRYFVDKLCSDFDLLSKEDRMKQLKKIFNERNLQEWYNNTLSGNKSDTADEIEEMTRNLSLFRNYKPDIQADTLYPSKKYAEKIKEAISSDYDDDIESQINQMSSNENLSRYRLYKLVHHAPKLLVPYFWSHLLELVNTTKMLRPPVVKKYNKIQQKQTEAVRTRRQSSKTKPFTENTIISEMEWSGLYYEENELIDELWNVRYSSKFQKCSEMPNAIIGIVAKCNVTAKVWAKLLNRFGRAHAGALLHEIVQSNAYNGPEVTQLILQRYKTTEDKKVLALAASNEGTIAAGITQVLLKFGRDPNAPTSTGLTPIHYAARNESSSGPEIMKLLLERGGNPNVRSTDDDNSTPVHWAAANQGEYAVEMLKHLLDFGGDYEVEDGNHLKPIHIAAMNSSNSAPELLDLLLNKTGPDVICEQTGRSLVHFAMFNDGECVKNILEKLFENGVKPNVGDIWKQTPLHYLAINSTSSQQKTTVLKILVRNGGNPNATDECGMTPVHYAAANDAENTHETLKFLISNGGNVKIKDKCGLTPIHYALLNTGIHGSRMRELVDVKEANINTPLDESGKTLLHHILSRGKPQTDHVQLILDHGGNPNIQNKLGHSPVHLAVSNPSSDSTIVLQLLLLKGGNPNLLDKATFRCSPVHYVAISHKDLAPEEMKILLNNGGDPNIPNKDRRTPLHLAANNEGCHGHNLTRILLEHGGNPNAVDLYKQTPLELAIRNSNDQLRLEIILQLLEKGGNPNAVNSKGWTPVHYAVYDKKNNSLKVLKLLLQYGGHINKCINNGITPFDLATRFGKKDYCLPKVKAHLLKVSRQTRSPEMNGIEENMHPKYIQVTNLFKQVPVELFLTIVIILLLYMFFFLYPILFK